MTAEVEEHEPTVRGSRRVSVPRAWRWSLLALAVYLALAVALDPDVVHPQSRTATYGDGDPGLFIWFLSNTSHAIWHSHGSGLLVSYRLNAPYGVNVMWNTGMLLPGALLSPVTELFGPVVTFNLLLAFSPAVSAWSAYVCSGRFFPSRWARLATGLAFGFSPAVIPESQGHIHLTVLPLVPPVLLLTWDLVSGHRRSWLTGLLLGLTVGAQLLVGEELVVLVAFAVALLLVALALQRPRQAVDGARRLVVGSAAALPALLVVAGYPLLVQLTGPQRVSGGTLQVPDRYKLDLAALVTPGPYMRFHTARSVTLPHADKMGATEFLGYVGVPMLLLVVVALVVGRRSLLVRTCLLVSAGLVVLALGDTLRFNGVARGTRLPWHLFSGIGPLVNVLPVRWMLVVDLLLAVVLGASVQALLVRRRRVLAGLLAVVVLLPFLPTQHHERPVTVPAYFEAGAPGLSGNVLLLPLPDPPHALPMTWQSVAGQHFNAVSGYFVGPGVDRKARFGPQQALVFRPWVNTIRNKGVVLPLTQADVQHILQDLRAIDVHTIVLGPSTQTNLYTSLVTQVVGRAPESDRGVLIWRDLPAG